MKVFGALAMIIALFLLAFMAWTLYDASQVVKTESRKATCIERAFAENLSIAEFKLPDLKLPSITIALPGGETQVSEGTTIKSPPQNDGYLEKRRQAIRACG